MKTNKSMVILIALAQIIATFAFIIILYYTKLLPNKYLLALGTVLLLLDSLVVAIIYNTKSKVRWAFGILLIVIMLVIYVFGGIYIIKGLKALNNITEISIERADIGIYVRVDDPADSIENTVGYNFGILETLDLQNTEKAIKEISELVDDIHIQAYSGIIELADSLLKTKEVDAIIINSAFWDMLEEIEGYGNIESLSREIHIEQVEVAVEPEPITQVEKKETIEKISEEISEAYTIYISGIDSRKGLSAKSRSDVNILVTINPKTRQAVLISTPRDYYIPLSISGEIPDKLTHAGIYGISVSMESMEMLYGTEIDYYFRVNFNGFEQIIDALGGISIESDYTFDSKNVVGYSFVKGKNQVNGAAALAFARERYSFAEGDRQRGKNQLEVIEGVINKAMSPALLANFSKILESVEGSFETSIPYDVVAEIVRNQLEDGGSWNVVSYSVDGTGANKKPYSLSANAYVMIPDYDTVNTATLLINQVKEGKTVGISN